MRQTQPVTNHIQVNADGPGPGADAAARVLTPAALEFVESLHTAFAARRDDLLAARQHRAKEIRAGRRLGFLGETEKVREGTWSVAPAPNDLNDRRVEITGPTDAKMMINALNSGAKVFMADLEDSNSPTWENLITGQANIMDAVRGQLEYTKPDGTNYEIGKDPATLVVRPRGWHLDESHLTIDGQPCIGALVDFGLHFFHNAEELIQHGSGPYYYLAKLESHEEARLWNDVFVHAQDTLGIPTGTIRATVLIETLPAAFEMDEILYELRQHAAGLNAGRWDYIFSTIKTLQHDPDAVLPDRAQVTMSVPFMRAYADLLVQTCHKRGAHAMGGMAAQVPNSREPERTKLAIAAVRADKERETQQGFDGTWVAHPALVPIAAEIFTQVLGDEPHQKHHPGADRPIVTDDLLDLTIPDGKITEKGLETNLDVGVRYLAAWLTGRGAVAIHGLMEDAATAEISRSQVWQWLHHAVTLDDGRPVDERLVRMTLERVCSELINEIGKEAYQDGRYPEAVKLFEQIILAKGLAPFLTTHALPALDLS